MKKQILRNGDRYGFEVVALRVFTVSTFLHACTFFYNETGRGQKVLRLKEEEEISKSGKQI